MRAGANSVQQTLTPEAAAVLKHGVAEACRRGHAQATPLHVAAALLAAEGSPLRRACIQTNPHSSHPLQCRALELCFSVALDRLPAAQSPLSGGQPLYSNALVAALKRAQAHQRRGCPEQQQQPLLAVKVELEQLVISVLDDPGVSRVMREAGYSSTVVKTHLEDMVDLMSSHHSGSSPVEHVGFRLNPSPGILGNMALRHHLPQYNLLHCQSPRTPFPMHPKPRATNPMDFASHSSENVTRIMDVLLRRKNRNPILIGDSIPSTEALIGDLKHRIESNNVPEKLVGVKMITLHLSALSLLSTTREETEMRLTDLNRMINEFMPNGTIIHVGDLQWLLNNSPPKLSSGGVSGFCTVQYAITEIKQILSHHGGNGRLWLIGMATCQTYLRCQVLHPCLEDLWSLQSVSVTATPLRLSLQPRYKFREAVANGVDASLTLTRSQPAACAPLKLPLLREEGHEKLNCCSICLVKYEQEFVLLNEQEGPAQSESLHSCATSLEITSKGNDSERSSSLTLLIKPTLPLWLQKALPANTAEIKEKSISLTQKLHDLRKKWNHTCQILHAHHMPHLSEQLQQLSPSFSNASGPNLADRRVNVQDVHNSNKLLDECSDYSHWEKHTGSVSLPQIPRPDRPRLLTGYFPHSAYQTKAIDISCQQAQPFSLMEEDLRTAWNAVPGAGSCMEVSENCPSVETDLSLGRTRSTGVLISSSPSKISGPHQYSNTHKGCVQDRSIFSQSLQSSVSKASLSPLTSAGPAFMSDKKQPDNFSMEVPWQVDPEAYKHLCKRLADSVGWQKEIISEIANTVLLCRSGMHKRKYVSLKGDTWMLFLGSDMVGKRKIAQALAEFVFGSKDKLLCVKCGTQHTSSFPFLMSLGQQESDVNKASFGRGKLPLDQLAQGVKLNPFSVVLLEDVDQSDLVVRNGLLGAMEKGRLLDSNGREVSFSNVIVIMTSSIEREPIVPQNSKVKMQFTEKRLASISRSGMKFVIGNTKCENVLLQPSSHIVIVNNDSAEEKATEMELSSSASTSKRKAEWNAEDEPANRLLGCINKKKGVEQTVSLDLNLSVQEDEAMECCEIELQEEHNATNLINDLLAYNEIKEFRDLVDATVVFHPFDFEALKARVIDVLTNTFVKISQGTLIEIDVKVLEHIIAAVWASNKEEVLVDWSMEVLGKSLSTMLSTCSFLNTGVVKLISEGDGDDNRPSILCLPSSISVDSTAFVE